MTDKELLIKDLCARLPYGVKATTTSNGWNGTYTITGYANDRIYLDCPVYDKGDEEWLVESVKPYLRSMASMTEEEEKMYTILRAHALPFTIVSWLDEHMFDHRTDMSGEHLIELGLALEAPKGIYNETV